MSPVTGLDGVGVCAQWHQHGPFTNETASNPSEVIYSFITWSESQWGIWNGTTRMDDITDDLPSLRTVGLLELHWHWLLCNRQHAVRGFYWSITTNPKLWEVFSPVFFSRHFIVGAKQHWINLWGLDFFSKDAVWYGNPRRDLCFHSAVRGMYKRHTSYVS